MSSISSPQNLIKDDDFLSDYIPEDSGTSVCPFETASCRFTAECCEEEGYLVSCNRESYKCERESEANLPFDAPASVEFPFCFMWSNASNYNFADMLGFAPTVPWPPLPGNKEGCDYASGIRVTEFSILGIPFTVLFQFRGFAISWSTEGKLAFGANDATQDLTLWDGFTSVDFPEIPGINFWVSFRFSIKPKVGKMSSRYQS